MRSNSAPPWLSVHPSASRASQSGRAAATSSAFSTYVRSSNMNPSPFGVGRGVIAVASGAGAPWVTPLKKSALHAAASVPHFLQRRFGVKKSAPLHDLQFVPGDDVEGRGRLPTPSSSLLRGGTRD